MIDDPGAHRAARAASARTPPARRRAPPGPRPAVPARPPRAGGPRRPRDRPPALRRVRVPARPRRRGGGGRRARPPAREGRLAAYGAFLVLEIWSAEDPESRRFTIHAPPEGPAPETIGRLSEALEALGGLRPRTSRWRWSAATTATRPGCPAALHRGELAERGAAAGAGGAAIYRDPDTGAVYPRFLRRLQRGLSRALRQAIHEFVRVQTSSEVENPLALGTRTLPDAVWEIDRALVAIERGFDLLLLVSPVNAETGVGALPGGRLRARNPEFHYRLLPIDPDLLKRRLFAIEMESASTTRPSPSSSRTSARSWTPSSPCWPSAAPDLPPQQPPPVRHGGRRPARRRGGAPRRGASRPDGGRASGWTRGLPRRRREGAGALPGAVSRAGQRDPDPPRRDRADGLGGEPADRRETCGSGRPGGAAPPPRGRHARAHLRQRQRAAAGAALPGPGRLRRAPGGARRALRVPGGRAGPLRMRLLAARVVAARTVEQGADFVETFRLLTATHGFSPARAPGTSPCGCTPPAASPATSSTCAAWWT
jgi:hypothetical protein